MYPTVILLIFIDSYWCWKVGPAFLPPEYGPWFEYFEEELIELYWPARLNAFFVLNQIAWGFLTIFAITSARSKTKSESNKIWIKNYSGSNNNNDIKKTGRKAGRKEERKEGRHDFRQFLASLLLASCFLALCGFLAVCCNYCAKQRLHIN